VLVVLVVLVVLLAVCLGISIGGLGCLLELNDLLVLCEWGW